MSDEETGTYWQQITGRAISGPLAGRQLIPVSSDELTFALWKAERPSGTVLNDVARYLSKYSPKDWDVEMAKTPVVISYAQAGLQPRDLMLGVDAFGASRAFPYAAVLKEKLIEDQMNGEPILLVVGPDNSSVRVFRRRVPGTGSLQFYRVSGTNLLLDADTGSKWNFEGCAVSGRLQGTCLEQVQAIKDYWFDWRNYHPQTTVYGIKQRIQ